MKRFLFKIILKYLFPDRMIQEISLRKRYGIFKRIKNDEDIMNLFRSEYTREYKTTIASWLKDTGQSKEFIQGFYAGRLFKLNELIRDAESSEEKLEGYEKQAIKEKSLGIQNDGTIKNNLIIDPY